MNNYQPQGTTSGGLINYSPAGIPVLGSPDAQLLEQQVGYASYCVSYVTTVAFQYSTSITSEVQAFYLRLMESIPLTLAQASAYFPGVSAGFWSSGVKDYKAAYAAMTSTPFPG